MADKKSKFTFELDAIDKTKKAFDSVKQNAQGASQVMTMGSGSGGKLPGMVSGLAGKSVEKSLDKMIILLRDIRQSSQIVAMGSGQAPSVRGAGMPTPFRKGGGLPMMLPGLKGGGIGMGGMAGLAKFLGPIGAAVGLLAGAYGVMNKMGSAFSTAVGPQAQAMQRIGIMAGGTGTMYGNRLDSDRKRGKGGYFMGMPRLGLTPSQEASFATAYSSQVDVMARSRGDILASNPQLREGVAAGNKGELWALRKGSTMDARNALRKRFETAASISAAYGIDTGTTANMMGQIERYTDPAAYGWRPGQKAGFYRRRQQGSRNIMQMMSQAEGVGMGGSRMTEFFNMYEKVMTSAVHKGMSFSNKGLLTGLGAIMGTGNEILKALAPSIMQSFQTVAAQGANLKGGPGGAFALQALYSGMEGPDRFRKARTMLAKGPTGSNINKVVEFASKRFKNKEIRDLVLMNTGMFGEIADPEMQRELFDYIGQKGMTIDKTTPGAVANQIKKVKERAKETEQIVGVTTGKEALEQLKSINDYTESAAGYMKDIKEEMTKFIQKGEAQAVVEKGVTIDIGKNE